MSEFIVQVYLRPEPGEASWPPVWTTAGINQGHPDILQATDGQMSYRPQSLSRLPGPGVWRLFISKFCLVLCLSAMAAVPG